MLTRSCHKAMCRTPANPVTPMTPVKTPPTIAEYTRLQVGRGAWGQVARVRAVNQATAGQEERQNREETTSDGAGTKESSPEVYHLDVVLVVAYVEQLPALGLILSAGRRRALLHHRRITT